MMLARSAPFLFFITTRRHPGPTLFPYTTLFRSVAPDLDARLTEAIKAAEPHIVWVGMSTPKQDIWMNDHLDRLPGMVLIDRKSTRLNSSHVKISYAVFCLKKKINQLLDRLIAQC